MKKILSDSIIYLATNFLSKAVGFFLIPVLTNPSYLSVEGYGQLILFTSLSMLLNPLIAFGGLDLIAIHYYNKNADHNVIIRRSNTWALLLCILSTILVLIFSPWLMRFLEIPLIVLAILPFSAFLNYFSEQLLLLLRFKGNSNVYFKVFVVRIVFDVGITLFCLIVLHWGWYSRVAGIFASLIFSFIITIRAVPGKTFLPIPRAIDIKEFTTVALPFVLLQFFIIGLTNVDKVIVPQIFKEKDQLAIYGLAFQLGYLLPTVTSALTALTQPLLYKILSGYTPEKEKKLKQIIYGSFLVILCTALVIYLLAPFVYDYFTKNSRYGEGLYLVKYMLVAWAFWCCSAVMVDIIKKTGTRRQIVNSYFIPFLVMLVSLYIFGSNFGLKGITYSLIISYGFIFLLLVVNIRKQLNFLLSRNK
ncbi:MAG TPA: hypothetical protein VI461_04500 [Chitinophagaceae bacterium]|nr:hypothetical protein [Chitinophagaceae bacterium]